MYVVNKLSEVVHEVKYGGRLRVSTRLVEFARVINNLMGIGGQRTVLVLGRGQQLVCSRVVFEDIGDLATFLDVEEGSVTSLDRDADRVDTGISSALLKLLAMHVFALDVVVGQRTLNQRVAQPGGYGMEKHGVLVAAGLEILLERLDRTVHRNNGVLLDHVEHLQQAETDIKA